MLEPEFIEQQKLKLLELKQRLTAELAELKPHTEVGNDYDEDTSLELQIDEVNQDVIRQLQKDLEKIDWALQKIEQGTYGIDDDGKAISKERLEAMPYADKAL